MDELEQMFAPGGWDAPTDPGAEIAMAAEQPMDLGLVEDVAVSAPRLPLTVAGLDPTVFRLLVALGAGLLGYSMTERDRLLWAGGAAVLGWFAAGMLLPNGDAAQ